MEGNWDGVSHSNRCVSTVVHEEYRSNLVLEHDLVTLWGGKGVEAFPLESLFLNFGIWRRGIYAMNVFSMRLSFDRCIILGD